MRCHAVAKNGDHCPAAAMEGANLCSFHLLMTAASKSQHRTPKTRAQRIVQLQKRVDRILHKEARKFCACRSLTVWFGRAPEEFEAAMNLRCPIHGQRRLGNKVIFLRTPPGASDLRLLELIREYDGRILLEEESSF
jgi:hypothetical protein